MDLTKVEASSDEIAAKLESYHGHTTAEDQRVLAAYRALEQGRVLINLPACVCDSFSYTSLPRIAVAPIWGDQVRLKGLRRDRFRLKVHRGVRRWSLTLPSGNRTVSSGTASIPYVPLRFRPEDSGDYLVMWEASWTVAQPKDPALLEHIAGDLWAVKATWDLTDVERAALSG